MWIQNFNRSGLKSVNFGYILLKKGGDSFYAKSIYNPSQAINHMVREYFAQISRLHSMAANKLYLHLAKDLTLAVKYSFANPNREYYLSSPNQFYSEYLINDDVYQVLQMIARQEPTLEELGDKDFIIDLIYKGIVKVSRQKSGRPYVNPYICDQVAATVVNSASPAADTAPVKEFPTKTTPTCLTSYIRQ